MAQVVEILPRRRQGTVYHNSPITWLLMPWLLVARGHQPPSQKSHHQRTISLTEINWSSIVVMAWISNYSHLRTVRCNYSSMPYFNGGLAKPPLKSDMDDFFIPCQTIDVPDSKVHGAHLGPTWVLSVPDGPHVGPMNHIRGNYVHAPIWLILS